MGAVFGVAPSLGVNAGRWNVEHLSGSGAQLHAIDPAPEAGPSVWVLNVTQPAIVLGSTQDESLVDREAAESTGFAVAKRRSGGGAVLVVPGDVVWLDVLVPAGDRRSNDDVGLASHWLGDVWANVVEQLGRGATVHRGGHEPGELGRLVCFASLGPGEVCVKGSPLGEGKIVGISQRRTRGMARFQCACLLRWDPTPFERLLKPLGAQQASSLRLAGTGTDADADQVVTLFLEAISQV